MSGLSLINAKNAHVRITDQGASAFDDATKEGVDWWWLPGVSGWTESPGEGATTEISAFEGSAQIADAPGPGTVNFDIASFSPQHAGWIAAARMRDANSLITVEVATLPAYLAPTSTGDDKASIAVSGLVTLEQADGAYVVNVNPYDALSVVELQNSGDVAAGDAIRVGSDDYVIYRVEARSPAVTPMDDPTADPRPAFPQISRQWRVRDAEGAAPAAAVAADHYSIRTPGLRLRIPARITRLPSIGTLALRSTLTAGLTIAAISIPARPGLA